MLKIQQNHHVPSSAKVCQGVPNVPKVPKVPRLLGFDQTNQILGDVMIIQSDWW